MRSLFRFLFLLAVGLTILWWLVDDRRGVAWAIRFVGRRFPNVRHLPIARLAAWLEDPRRPAPQIADVRSEEEYEVSHLAGARRIDPVAPLDEVQQELDPTKPVVVYCSAGYRSARMARRLQQAGFSQVSNLAGGIFAWANAGLPIESKGQPTRAVHPFLRIFSRMVAQP